MATVVTVVQYSPTIFGACDLCLTHTSWLLGIITPWMYLLQVKVIFRLKFFNRGWFNFLGVLDLIIQVWGLGDKQKWESTQEYLVWPVTYLYTSDWTEKQQGLIFSLQISFIIIATGSIHWQKFLPPSFFIHVYLHQDKITHENNIQTYKKDNQHCFTGNSLSPKTVYIP